MAGGDQSEVAMCILYNSLFLYYFCIDLSRLHVRLVSVQQRESSELINEKPALELAEQAQDSYS